MTGRGRVSPTGTTTALLHNPKQFGLIYEAQLSKLVQKKSAPISGAHESQRVSQGAGESTLEMAEHLAFKQAVAEGSEIHCDERAIGAATPHEYDGRKPLCPCRSLPGS